MKLKLSSALAMVAIVLASTMSTKAQAAEPKSHTPLSTEAVQKKNANTIDELKKGNARFMNGESTNMRQDPIRIQELSAGQDPNCIIVSCSDSRVPPEIIFDQGLGDIFSIRTAGNIMSDYDEGSIEYAVEHLHTPLIIVMGHQKCGAVQAFLDMAESNTLDEDHAETAGNVVKIIDKLANQDEQQALLHDGHIDTDKAVLANVMNGVRELRTMNPLLKQAYDNGEIEIVGAIYNVDNGSVDFLDY